jgi:FtsZ-binding cell division protein ZapB
MSKERLKEYVKFRTGPHPDDVRCLLSEVEELTELNKFLDNRVHEQHKEYQQLEQKAERLEKALKQIINNDKYLLLPEVCVGIAKQALKRESKA